MAHHYLTKTSRNVTHTHAHTKRSFYRDQNGIRKTSNWGENLCCCVNKLSSHNLLSCRDLPLLKIGLNFLSKKKNLALIKIFCGLVSNCTFVELNVLLKGHLKDNWFSGKNKTLSPSPFRLFMSCLSPTLKVRKPGSHSQAQPAVLCVSLPF